MGTQNVPKEGAENARPWPDFPQQLIRSIARQPTLMHDIGTFGCVTKSWRMGSRKCKLSSKSPWPQLSDDGELRQDKHQPPRDFNILFYINPYWWSWRRRMPPLPWAYSWEHFVGFSQGVLVVKGLQPFEYFLWKPSQSLKSCLPPWDDKVPFRFVALSSPWDWDCVNAAVLVLTGISSPAFVFYRFFTQKDRDYKWERQDSTLVDPYGSNKSLMQFSNAIGFDRKFYALSLQGSLVVIEDTDESQLTVTVLSKSRAVPSAPCRHFKEYLVESCGEILLVFLISKKTFNIVDHAEVFRLHFPKLSWVKMEKLGDDRALFAGANCCMSVSASKVGCRRNCVYFSQLADENWWVYDMESDCISPGLSNGKQMTIFRHAMDEQRRANTQ